MCVFLNTAGAIKGGGVGGDGVAGRKEGRKRADGRCSVCFAGRQEDMKGGGCPLVHPSMVCVCMCVCMGGGAVTG